MRRIVILVSVLGLVVSLTAASASYDDPGQDFDLASAGYDDPGRDFVLADFDLASPADAAVDGHDHSTHDDFSTEVAGHSIEAAALDTPAAGHLPDNDHARGLVFDGLRPGAQDGPCGGAYEIPLPNDKVVCTHGPDAGPAGVDVRAERSVADLAAAAADAGGTAAEAGAGMPCIGDGVSGSRVQAIYAVASDRTDRYAEIEPLIEQWAGAVDEVFAHSAAQVGGERHVRFVTDAGCGLAVERVVLSPFGDDTMWTTINELAALGYDRDDRKYLIWMDAAVYCGVAQTYPDDQPGQDNLSNVRSGFARLDQGCWGGTHSVEAHELVHALGGVQPSAPHATAQFHCTDEEDRLCYKDSADVVLTFDCPVDNARYLDCNHDDYYHPSPSPGSYLDNHWNVADSGFLHAGAVGDPVPPPPPTNVPPEVSAVAPASTMLGDGAALDGTVSDDGMPGPYAVTWSQVSGPGTATFAEAGAEDTAASFSAPGVYVLMLMADDGELTGDDSVTVTVEEVAPPPAPTSTTETFSGSITRKWSTRTFETTVADGPADASLTFSSGRGKKAATVELTLNIYDAADDLVATSTGRSPVELSLTLGAGTYTWEVTGSKTSFSLEVTHMTS